MEAETIQMEIARLRIDDRLKEAERIRKARSIHTPRRPRPVRPASSG
jgi:hypothetical protein